jgi:hypothetical protein
METPMPVRQAAFHTCLLTHGDRPVFFVYVRSIVTVVLALTAASAFAQTGERSSWGVIGGFVPQWDTSATIKNLFDADTVNLSGGELRIGVVRGRVLSGDWGVSFVRKSFSADSVLEGITGALCEGNSSTGFKCQRYSFRTLAPNLSLTGVEVHKFISFHTFKERVQVGMNLAGGIAGEQGHLERHEYIEEFPGAMLPGPPGTGTLKEIGVSQMEFGDTLIAKTKYIPLWKAEAAVAFIAAPGFKIRVSGGFNYPGMNRVSIAALYLFN